MSAAKLNPATRLKIIDRCSDVLQIENIESPSRYGLVLLLI